jgi:hypothetical protein
VVTRVRGRDLWSPPVIRWETAPMLICHEHR